MVSSFYSKCKREIDTCPRMEYNVANLRVKFQFIGQLDRGNRPPHYHVIASQSSDWRGNLLRFQGKYADLIGIATPECTLVRDDMRFKNCPTNSNLTYIHEERIFMQIIKDRRALHAIPELEWQLPKTMEYLKTSLKPLNCRVFDPAEGALCVFFDFGAEDAIAFRADCDALPIGEKNDASYASRHPGQMHACGHDGHMAVLLELARRLSEKETLPHNVLLVFQPGEESPGGAKEICETGVFEKYRVGAIFGLHLWPGVEAGRVFSRREELMSRSCEVNVDVYGKSAHIAKAAEGIDALTAGVEFYRRAVAMEQALPGHVFRLLKFGRFQSGMVRNALSEHTHIEGSLRAFQDDTFFHLRRGLDAIATEVEREFGCKVSVSANEGYPAVMNPSDLYDRVKAVADFEELAEPSMTSEDFSWYQRYIPGMFFFLGLGDTPALHADNFDFDDSILAKGADFFEQLAEKIR